MFIQKAEILGGEIKYNKLGKVKEDELEPGLTDKNYVHNQLSPSDIWIVNHNLGKYPSVAVIDSAGSKVEGDVEYTSNMNLQISFTSQFAGIALCN
jgi:hypothetical protein